MQRVIDEVLAVARATGVRLPNIEDSTAGMTAAMEIATQMAGAFSSTAQDIQRGKPTEIDSLNGYIARRGAQPGVEGTVYYPVFVLGKMMEHRFSARYR